MKRSISLAISCAWLAAGALSGRAGAADYTQFVNPFIGGAENGHAFPGACHPFGLVQASPDTGNCTWANPCNDGYVLGAPQIGKITLNLAGGKTFAVEAKNLSKENKYVQSVALDGQPVAGIKIAHADVMKDGRLVFEMGPKP